MRLRLTVERSLSELRTDQQGLIHLDPEAMAAAGIEVGDLVLVDPLVGWSVPARVAPPLPGDAGKGWARLDRCLRQATKARLNQALYIERLESWAPVSKAVLVPAVDVTGAHHLEEHVQATLGHAGVPAGKGSVLYCTFHRSVAGTTYRVKSVEPGPGPLTPETHLVIDPTPRKASGDFDTTFADVGGLVPEIRLLRELVQLPLQLPHAYRQLGINPPRGIILYGPPGTGKTHLARAMANEVDARLYYINGPEVVGTLYGETEANLRKIFAEATHHAPSLILIDEVDALAPRRGDTGSHSDTRMVTQLLSLMDGLSRVESVIVVGTTNRIDSVDMALRRPGRFDRELFVGPPNAAGRREILEIHTREMPLTPAAIDHLDRVVAVTHGFVGADIMELCREAGLAALREGALGNGDHLSAFDLKTTDLVVEPRHLDAALLRVRPSALRESLVRVADVRWDEVGGLAGVKSDLERAVRTHLAPPQGADAGPVTQGGILLYGPPGTGKTLLARALAQHSGANFLAVNGPEIFSKWLGESEEAVRHLFRVARQLAPALIFIDQLDAIAPRRSGDSGARTTERVVNQLLVELDGLEPRGRILVVAATNRLDLVDPSLLRPGRMGTHLYVGLPAAAERAEILGIHLGPAAPSAAVIAEVAAVTEGMTGAALKAVADGARAEAAGRPGYVGGAAISRDDLAAAAATVQAALARLQSGPKGG